MAKKKAEEAQEAAGTATAEKITKSEAVRRAVAEGVDKPTDAVAFIKERFGVEISAQHFSSIKSQEAKKAGKPGRRGRKPREAAAVVATPNGSRVGNRNPAELARQVKQLVESFGAEAVRDMTAVFER